MSDEEWAKRKDLLPLAWVTADSVGRTDSPLYGMFAMVGTLRDALPSGAVRVAWRTVPNAKAYFAGVMGAATDGTMVMWSSSERQ